MDLKKSSTSANNLQDLILEGRKILMKKPDGNYFIQIRAFLTVKILQRTIILVLVYTTGMINNYTNIHI